MVNGKKRASLASPQPVPARIKKIVMYIRLALYSPRAFIVSMTPAVNSEGVYGWDVKMRPLTSVGEVSR